MNLNYVRVGTFTPEIKVGDVDYNLTKIKEGIDIAKNNGLHILSFPELCLTGYTAGDLFYQKTLLDKVKDGISEIAKYTKNKNILVFIGAPIKKDGLIYNCSIGISDGVILGIVPKSYLPDYGAFNEKRYFAPATDELSSISLFEINGEKDFIPFGKNIIFADDKNDSLKISTEVCEDLWSVIPPSLYHSINGARIIVNLSASAEYSGEVTDRKSLIKSHSKKAVCAYVYANSGRGESTTDCVFSGHSVICENGEILKESEPFESALTYADVDLDVIDYNRSKIFNYDFDLKDKEYLSVGFSLDISFNSDRTYRKTPFINEGEEDFLLTAQAEGLMKRITHTNAKTIVLGLSGGLDSTLALIVAIKALKRLNRSPKELLAITMPCFGTSSRTLDNSIKLAKAFGATLKKVDITKSVKRHLKDIGHSIEVHDAAYENAQARERTQVLMDIANMCNGLVLGTGDLSELALGWATYNGDHMSMYAVNGSVPKTLVRHLVEFTAKNSKGKLKAVLLDIVDTPVSPELIPSNDNTIKQVTEDIVGPYVLHDYFLYSMLVKGFSPKKIYYTAVNTFNGEFDKQTILKWLKTFVRRFFNQQFKRSCLPDGVKVTEISLSPRTGYKMPSDAVSKLWLDELEDL